MSASPAAKPDDAPAGTRFGRYEVVRLIGGGGMAVVYEARHMDLQKRVALKVMRAAYAAQSDIVRRFAMEARTASRLQHPHVISVSDVDVERGLPFLVMDYLEGEDLFDVLARTGPLPIDRLADIVLAIVSAVAAAHAEGILHRDLKPENIFLARGRRRDHPVLLDFGISTRAAHEEGKAHRAKPITRAGEVVGTPHYMSPEQLSGDANLDGRADQYALGVILYECATKSAPFRAQTLTSLTAEIFHGVATRPSLLRPDLPPELDAVILRAMHRSRDERFPTVRDLGRALWPFASPLAQAMWAEELGDPDSVAHFVSLPPARLSSIPRQAVAPTLPAPPPAPADVTPAQLRALPALAECDDDSLLTLLRQARIRRVPAGTRLIEQDAHGHSCFLLIAGEVEVIKRTATAKVSLGRMAAPCVFGHIALVANVARTASVSATAESLLVEISREVFERLLASSSDAAMRLREHAAICGVRQLRAATRHFASLQNQVARPAGETRDERAELDLLRVAALEWSVKIPHQE